VKGKSHTGRDGGVFVSRGFAASSGGDGRRELLVLFSDVDVVVVRTRTTFLGECK
jgi:hypothetical protein